MEKETALGKVEVSGFPREQWASQAKKLWKQGESIYLSGQQEDGTHAQTKYFRREEYLPVNTIVELDDREFRVDSVNFEQETVSLQDTTLAKEARYPIFRTEPLEYIRHLYEQADVPMEEAVEITVFTALHNAGVAYEDFSPEQMDVIYSVAESGGALEDLLNPEFPPEQMQLIADVQNRTDAISRAAAEEALEPLTQQPMTTAEVNHARRQHNLPLDSGVETELPAQSKQESINFHITDNDLGAGGPKTKYKANVEAIRLLKTLDVEQRQATAEEQEILSRYVGWGGIPQVFDENNADWSKEYAELESLLTADEYKEARASTLNAFYTSPTVIKAMYEALGNMGLSKGNVLEPSCGVGNFMGLVPDSMEKIRMYGVELDNISGRIAQQLYQKNKIAVQGFETMQFPDSFFDCVVGNVPFGNYKVPDKRYDRHNFLIHDYFIAKSLDLVRPGGVVAVVTSSGTMDKKDSSVREYLANRADLVGAIRLPNNAFQRNAKGRKFFYVDKEELVEFGGFMDADAAGNTVVYMVPNYQIDGKTGTWLPYDSEVVEGVCFFMMRNEQRKDAVSPVVVDSKGVFVTDAPNGFENVRSILTEYVHRAEKKQQDMTEHEKCLTNGTYERARESGTEQNYDMIDGCVNNVPKKPRRIGGRWSVLDRLHIKQAQRKQKDQTQQQQQQERSRKN